MTDREKILLSDLIAGEPLDRDLYRYLPRARTFLLWRRQGELLSKESFDFLEERGESVLYFDPLSVIKNQALQSVHPKQQEAGESKKGSPDWQALLQDDSITVEGASDGVVPQYQIPPSFDEDASSIIKSQSDASAQFIHQALQSTEPKKELIQEAAKLMSQVLVKSPEALAQSVEYLVEKSFSKESTEILSLWNQGKIKPNLSHGNHVASYAVLFGLLLGMCDRVALRDLVIAGLIHDIGVCRVPVASLLKAETKRFSKEQVDLQAHVDQTLYLIKRWRPEIPTRVLKIIGDHHEAFDGTGYPKQKRGFDITDMAQILSLANFLDEMMTGAYDGVRRNIVDSLVKIEKMESAGTFPVRFNPDITRPLFKVLKEETERVQAVSHTGESYLREGLMAIEPEPNLNAA